MPARRAVGTAALGLALLLPAAVATASPAAQRIAPASARQDEPAAARPVLPGSTAQASQGERADAEEPLAPLAFMAGCWRGDAYGGRGFVEERFTPAVGGLMLGTTRYVREGVVQLFEFHRIEARGAGVVLVAWLVVFFVVDGEGTARHGSAEGGTYSLEGDRLVFRHEYHLAGGEGVAGMPPSPLRLELQEAGGTAVEPSRIELEGDRLTIHFPSGNRMTFRREPGVRGAGQP